jgi:carboxymethylenebutenolidase
MNLQSPISNQKRRLLVEMFAAGNQTGSGYLALPEGGTGPGVLMLHAWWGLTPFFKSVCDQMASEGFVVFAPDLHQGRTAQTIEAAQQLLDEQDFPTVQAIAHGSVAYLRTHPQARGADLGIVGFSMGAAWALTLASELPEAIAATVIFYGAAMADFTKARTVYIGHFGLEDEWEPLDGVRQMEADMRAAGRDVTIYTYPEAKHWFFEDDREGYYNKAIADLAWERTVVFLRHHLTLSRLKD